MTVATRLTSVLTALALSTLSVAAFALPPPYPHAGDTKHAAKPRAGAAKQAAKPPAGGKPPGASTHHVAAASRATGTATVPGMRPDQITHH